MDAPITVHPPSPTGGRRVSVDGTSLGLARSDRDLVTFLEAAGLQDAEHLVNANSPMIEWLGGPAHEYETD